MTRVNLGRAVLALCAAIASCGVSIAEDDVLTVVPDNALGVVVINDVGETDEKLNELASQLELPPPSLLATAKIGLNLQDGLDETGSMALAAIPAGEGGAPVMAMLLPVTDFQALIKPLSPEEAGAGMWKIALGPTKKALVARKGGFAIIVDNSDRAVLQTVLKSAADIAAATPSMTTWRAESDAYAVATPAGIKFAQTKILAGLAVAKQQLSQMPEAQAQQARTGIELYESLFKSLDKEVTYSGVGLRMGDDGIHLVGRTLLAEGGVMAKLAASAKPGGADALANLPKMPFVFAGGGAMSGEAIEPMMKASFSMMKMYPGGNNLTEKQFKKIVAISVRSMQGLQSMGMVMGVGKADQPLYSGLVLTMKVDDADAYLDRYVKTMAEMGKIMEEAEFPMSYEAESQQIEGRKGLKMTVDMAGMIPDQDVPGAEMMLEMMFGGGKTMDVYMAVADKNTIIGSYVSKDKLVAALNNFGNSESQLVETADVAKAIEMLDGDAQFLGLWSPQGTLAFATRLMSAIEPQVADAIPQLEASPPVGFTAKLSPAGLETDMAVPSGVMKSISALVRQMMAAQGQAPPGAL